MSAIPLLVRHSLKRVRALIIVACLMLAGFQVIMILVAASVQESNAFGQMAALMPAFARELMGPAMMSFGGIVCLGYFHLAVMGSLTAIAIMLGTMPASESEIGFMDLILARPVARRSIITRSILMLAICTTLLIGAMVAGTWGGLTSLAPKDAAWPRVSVVRSLALNLSLLIVSWGAVAMAIGCASRRRAVAGAIAGVLAVGTFLLDYVGRAWKTAEPASRLSPFHYYTPFDLLLNKPLPLRNMVVLGTITLFGFVLSYVLFTRRDITR